MTALCGYSSLQTYALLREFAFFLAMQGALCWQNVYTQRNDNSSALKRC